MSPFSTGVYVMQNFNPTRNTQKSRMVEDIAESIVTLVADGDYAPSKKAIADLLTSQSLSPNASTAITSTVFSEISNEVERYFSESCTIASQVLQMPDYHLVTSKFYRDFDRNVAPTPQSEHEAKKYVCVFGNGQRGKSEGVRFVTDEDYPDPMYLVYLEKSTDVVNSAIDTHREKQRKLLETAQLSDAQREALARSVGLPLSDIKILQTSSKPAGIDADMSI